MNDSTWIKSVTAMLNSLFSVGERLSDRVRRYILTLFNQVRLFTISSKCSFGEWGSYQVFKIELGGDCRGSLWDLNAALCSPWQGCGNLSPQPLWLLENSLRKTNGGRAALRSSVRADRGDAGTLGYWHFHTETQSSASCVVIQTSI